MDKHKHEQLKIMQDLFEHIERLPIPMQELIAKHGETETYADCEAFLKASEALGYTFDYDTAATCFDLEMIR